jgi:hypothetical protein
MSARGKVIKRLILRSAFITALLALWLLLVPQDTAHADEISTVQVTPSESSTVTVIVLTPTATIEAAQTAITQAESATALIETQAIAITSPTETITATITQAQTSILQAQTVVDSATVAVNNVVSIQNSLAQAVETQTARAQVVASESLTVTTLNDSMTVMNTQIDSQTAIVNSDSSTVVARQGDVALVQNQIRLESAGNPQTTDLPKDDDYAFRMNLPYALKLGDQTYTDIYVATNGLITFGTLQGWGGNAPAVYINFRDWWNVDQDTYVRYSTTINRLLVEWNVVPFATHSPQTSKTYMAFDADVNPLDGSWKADISSVGMSGNNFDNPLLDAY